MDEMEQVVSDARNQALKGIAGLSGASSAYTRRMGLRYTCEVINDNWTQAQNHAHFAEILPILSAEAQAEFCQDLLLRARITKRQTPFTTITLKGEFNEDKFQPLLDAADNIKADFHIVGHDHVMLLEKDRRYASFGKGFECKRKLPEGWPQPLGTLAGVDVLYDQYSRGDNILTCAPGWFEYTGSKILMPDRPSIDCHTLEPVITFNSDLHFTLNQLSYHLTLVDQSL